MIDAAVIGGGPAGLAVAIGLRLDGLSVCVFEKSAPPIDKACGEGLMPAGLKALQRLGVLLTELDLDELDLDKCQPFRGDKCQPFRGISYVDGEVTAYGHFSSGDGLGLRRTVLYQELFERAEEVGVEIRQVRVNGIFEDGDKRGVEIEQERIPCHWIIGADGLRSRVRSWMGNPEHRRRRDRFGVRRHYRVSPWTDFVEVHLGDGCFGDDCFGDGCFGDGCEAYVTPIASDEVGIAILWSGRKAKFDELILSFPRLCDRLDGAPITSKDRGIGPLRQKVDFVARGKIALVGDASGYIDALTGEGLALAFRQAEALRKAIGKGDLREYVREHRRIGRRAKIFAEMMLILERRPWLRRRVVRLLARRPELFDFALRLKG